VDKISNQESSEYFNKIKRADSINEVRPVYSNSPVIKQNYIVKISSLILIDSGRITNKKT